MNNLSFGEFTLDCSSRQLKRSGEILPVYGKSFDLLVYMANHPGRPLLKSELLSAVWPDTIVEEANLSQNVSQLRKVIGSGSDGPILTLPGRGYQFAVRVTKFLPEDPAAESGPVGASPSTQEHSYSLEATHTRILVQEEVIDEAASRRAVPILVWLGAGAVFLAIAGWFGWQRWLDRSGGAPVQIVLVPFEGTTGDPVLDKSLTQAIRMDLAQSPYVTVVPTGTVAATLTQMQRKPDEAITSAAAREVCERTNSQSFLSGNISRVGSHFLIYEEASNCVDGSFVGAAKEEAVKPEDLPRAVDKLAARLRQKLGESRRSIARFNMPLYPDNTASLDALKAFTLGTQAVREGRFTEAVSLLKTAVADDPQFAGAYYNLAAAYGSVGDDPDQREVIAKAYSLKDTAPKQTQFAIQTMYDNEYTGDMYELVRSFQSWTALYPNSSQAWSGLANAQRDLGMDSQAIASQRRTVELLPHSQGMLANLALDQMETNDPKAAVATCERAVHDNLDGDGIRVRYLQVAYLLKDPEMLRAQRAWATAHPESLLVPAQEASIAMSEGRFADARALIEHIHDLQKQQRLSGADDERVKYAAVELMQTGDLVAGKKIFQQSPVDLEEGQEVLGLAYAGDLQGAQAALRASEIKYPQATMPKLFWGPRTRAVIAFAQHKPGEAAALLETARPLERIGRSIPWLRGNAYLADGKAVLAEKDFRSVIDHPEIDPTSPYISLSWLGLARSLAAENNRTGAIDAYRHFLSIWAHADPDATFLLQAKQELKVLEQSTR